VRGLAQERLSVDQWLVITITDDEDATAPDETVCRDPVSITISSRSKQGPNRTIPTIFATETDIHGRTPSAPTQHLCRWTDAK